MSGACCEHMYSGPLTCVDVCSMLTTLTAMPGIMCYMQFTSEGIKTDDCELVSAMYILT